MAQNSTVFFESDKLNRGIRSVWDVDAVPKISKDMQINLFNGYTWPGWLTMTMCFLGAATNIFHVSFCNT